jgi:Domain of unknown function (DUF4398)
MRLFAPFLCLGLWLALGAAHAGPATERYAPVQLGVASKLLEQARAAAALGENARAGRLAWQASLDARLAWGMTDSEQLRAEAAELGGRANALVKRLTLRR